MSGSSQELFATGPRAFSVLGDASPTLNSIFPPFEVDVPMPPGTAVPPNPPTRAATVPPGMPMRGLREVPLDLLAQRPLSGWQIVQKSVLDRTLAALMLILMAPLLLGLALLIKLDSPGPVLFRQRRVGMDGVPFDLLKFRTMHVNDTEAALAKRATTHGDARITGVGRWLRRLSLDELPEVLNVLRGEMSLVGPRPHMLGAIPLLDQRFADYARRHHIKPGITGWAQINGIRGDLDSHESIRRSLALDCYYIENWSLALDVYVLLRAVAFGDTGRNAY